MTDDPYRDDPIRRVEKRLDQLADIAASYSQRVNTLNERSTVLSTHIDVLTDKVKILSDRQPTTPGWIGSTIVAAVMASVFALIVVVGALAPAADRRNNEEARWTMSEERARVTREQDRALCDRTCATAERPTAVAADCSWLPRGRRTCACVCRANPSERDLLGGELSQHDETIRITESR